MRVGIGYDVHPLVEGRRLVLGGVEIPFEAGLAGHSDADALVHAIIDALLGAASLGDIGTHFPDTDPQYKDISSLRLLRQVGDLLQNQGWRVGNIDATVVAEHPQLSSFIPQMCQMIGEALGIREEQIGVKATTSKRLGFLGKGEGIAAYAVALVEKQDETQLR
jgi:2-C-methyl-D-erythritol 2,4-cyclodiphosphate synthase